MDDDLIDVLGHVTFVLTAELAKVAAQHDLSLTQLRLLGILRDRRVRMSGLAAYLGLDKSSLTGLVSRAEQRDLVARTPSPDDRRAVDVELTAAGRRLMRQVEPAVVAAFAPLTGRLPAADRHRLHTLLVRMIDGIEPGRAR